jgi:hypothetical protein
VRRAFRFPFIQAGEGETQHHPGMKAGGTGTPTPGATIFAPIAKK